MYYLPAAVFVTAFLTCVYASKKTIFIATKKLLFDEPTEERKIHNTNTPNLGGAAIFSAFAFTMTVFSPYYEPNKFHGALIAASIIIFFIGLTDDLSAITPLKKLGGQLSAALLVCLLSDLRIKHLNGFLGIYELPYLVSVCASVSFIVFVINAYNLMDGVNWLAGSVTLIGTITYSYLFYSLGEMGYFLAGLALSGCIIAFLIFNKTPARIFMGDSGSLFLGFAISLFSLRFLQPAVHQQTVATYLSINSLMIVFSIIAVPVLDTVRVFGLRVIRRKSPFVADRNHLHHNLLSTGYTHLQIAGVISLTVLSIILLSIFNKGSLYSSFAVIVSIPITLMIISQQKKPFITKISSNKSKENSSVSGKLILLPMNHVTTSDQVKPERLQQSASSEKGIKRESANQIVKESVYAESSLP